MTAGISRGVRAVLSEWDPVVLARDGSDEESAWSGAEVVLPVDLTAGYDILEEPSIGSVKNSLTRHLKRAGISTASG